ncbi:hypothetical protein [Micromonospora aurantiaca (nom. illeg.)]|uniref:hypothetical protein n=1 Tax=Micromonospora aurantiaca (nom. illeg.) TaxID=47850 RepID=UPI003425491F
MTWFKVDDSFHSHPKVLAASPAALGLWVVAGSWSGANLSDGFVPDHVLPRLLPDSDALAKELVTAGLWRRARGGYRFHDWLDFNPQRDTIEEERKAARERMRNLRSKRKAAGQPRNGSDEQQANVRDMFVTPTRPDPYKGGPSTPVTTDRAPANSQPPTKSINPEKPATVAPVGDDPAPAARAAEPRGIAADPPPERCQRHLDDPDPPNCGPCADARRARERWETARRQRLAAAPTCRIHRGQPAHNCGPCRSERLAGGREAP